LHLAFIVELFAARQSEFDLGAAFFIEIKLQRHERHALALDGADQLIDLPPMQQQLSRPLGRVIETVGLQVFRDVGVDQPDFATPRIGVGFGDGCLALAQRLDLRAGERQAGLEGFVNKIIEPRLAIVGDNAKLSLGARCPLSHLHKPSPRPCFNAL